MVGLGGGSKFLKNREAMHRGDWDLVYYRRKDKVKHSVVDLVIKWIVYKEGLESPIKGGSFDAMFLRIYDLIPMFWCDIKSCRGERQVR